LHLFALLSHSSSSLFDLNLLLCVIFDVGSFLHPNCFIFIIFLVVETLILYFFTVFTNKTKIKALSSTIKLIYLLLSDDHQNLTNLVLIPLNYSKTTTTDLTDLHVRTNLTRIDQTEQTTL